MISDAERAIQKVRSGKWITREEYLAIPVSAMPLRDENGRLLPILMDARSKPGEGSPYRPKGRQRGGGLIS